LIFHSLPEKEIYGSRTSSTFAGAGFWNITGGILGGLLAALFGFLDWLAIPSGTRAKRIGLLHGSVRLRVGSAASSLIVLRSA